MGKALFTWLIVFILCNICYAGGAPVFDATNATHLLQLISKLNSVTEQLNDMNQAVVSVKQLIKDKTLTSLNSNMIDNYLNRLNKQSLYINNLYTYPSIEMKTTNIDDEINQYNEKLKILVFPKNVLSDHLHEYDQTKSDRNQLLLNSCYSSMYLAKASQLNTKEVLQEIKQVQDYGDKTTSIYDSLKETNKILYLISIELVTQRELISKLLELQSAVHIQMLPTYVERFK